PLVVALFSTPAPLVTTPVPGVPEGSEVENTHKKSAPAVTTQDARAGSIVTAGNSNTVIPASTNTVITGKNNTANPSPPSTTTSLDEDMLLSLANLAKGASDIQQHFIEQNDADLILKERSAWLSSASDYVKQSVSASVAIRFQNAPAAKGCPLDHPVDGCGAYRDLE